MRKIVSNIGWIFFDKLFRMATGILVGIWVARYLGPSDFGLLNYAILFPTIFASFASFGLTNVLMVDYVEAGDDSSQKHQLLSNGLLIKLVMGLMTYAVTLGLNYYLNKDNPLLFLLINITGSVLVFQSSDVVDTYFQSQTKAKISVIVKLITFSLAAVVRIYGLYAHYSIVFFATINLVESFFASGLMLGVYQVYSGKLISTIFSSVNKDLISRLVRIGWPVMFTEFFVYVYMRVDQFMIESLSTNKELGLYGAALRLSESWYFVAIAICSSLYPKIAELWTSNKAEFYDLYQSMLNILAYTSIGIAIIISLFADHIISLLYGVKFDGAGDILRVHIWSGVFVFIGVGINNLMIMESLQKFVLVKTISAALLNIVLNLWLIPKYGALGASIATLFAQGMSSYGMNILNNRAKFVFHLQTKSFINFLTFKKPIDAQKLLRLR